jgi:GMP synthase-like glutamine amidotransferase
VQRLGGEVAPADKREYGRMPIATQPGGLFAEAGSQMVWMSHGDEAKRLPDGFVCVAKSEQVRRRLLAPPGFLAAAAHARGVQGAVVAVECKERNVYGLQYHPEARSAQLAPLQGDVADVACSRHPAQVTHTDRGMETLRRFLFDISGVKPVRSLRACARYTPAEAEPLSVASPRAAGLDDAERAGRAAGGRARCRWPHSARHLRAFGRRGQRRGCDAGAQSAG